MKKFTLDVKTLADESGKSFSEIFSGTIDVSIPNYKERLALIKVNGLLNDGKDIEKAQSIIELTEKHVSSVDVVYEETGEQLTSLDELSYMKEGSSLINTIGRTIIQGISLPVPFAKA